MANWGEVRASLRFAEPARLALRARFRTVGGVVVFAVPAPTVSLVRGDDNLGDYGIAVSATLNWGVVLGYRSALRPDR